MAIFNAQTVSSGSSNWEYATFTATSSTSTEVQSISFSVSGKPKAWGIAPIKISSSYYTVPTTSGQYRTISAYFSDSSVIGAEAVCGSSVAIKRNTTSPTGSYSNGTFTITAGTNRAFPMKRSSYYFTWYLFYTV